jgi:hypothetical protein
MQIPEGWVPAERNAASMYVISQLPWGTDCMILADGSSYGTTNYVPGMDCWFDTTNPLLDVDANGFNVRLCNRRILLVRKTSFLPACSFEQCVSYAPSKCSSSPSGCTCVVVGQSSYGVTYNSYEVGYKGGVYRSLDAVDPTNATVGCQTQLLALPTSAFPLASQYQIANSYTWTSYEIEVIALYPWEADCMVTNDGPNGFRSWPTSVDPANTACSTAGVSALLQSG